MKPAVPFLALSLALAALLAGCQDRSPAPVPASPPPAAEAAPTAPAADAWLGRWNGPEGTYLELAGGQGTYQVTVRNLDGPRTFPGKAVGEGIGFERDGVQETLRATNGADTGMKWLAEKSRCLTVRAGEGYCRD